MDVSPSKLISDRATATLLMRSSTYSELPHGVKMLADRARASDGRMQVIGLHPRTGIARTPCQDYLPGQIESVFQTYLSTAYLPVALVTPQEVAIQDAFAIYVLRLKLGEWEVLIHDFGDPGHICDGNRGHNAQDCPYHCG